MDEQQEKEYEGEKQMINSAAGVNVFSIVIVLVTAYTEREREKNDE